MSEVTTSFFHGLGERAPDLLPRRAHGTLRFDLRHGAEIEHWFVSMHHGNMSVSQDRRDADCVVHVAGELFDRFATGDANVISAMIRTDCVLEGNIPLLMMFRRFFPAAPDAVDPRRLVRERDTR
ncbi:SCP2 sterol-binding domain-containing protein [Micromonospora sp. NBC_01699]|uniref:SCP2 sterol-binding domain-containing protein n=1 Tax=Micromonospora sp. NBC_01699 TaxID=2975984 RepID=UPI002E2D8E63|nr:SCP2 sterol-binding domain-containing protein [Micromonospora sp. NBC_01699]